ncbi:MAG TPA: hypothetical protein VF683_06825, partial [Chthoniobacterales bacterium]
MKSLNRCSLLCLASANFVLAAFGQSLGLADDPKQPSVPPADVRLKLSRWSLTDIIAEDSDRLWLSTMGGEEGVQPFELPSMSGIGSAEIGDATNDRTATSAMSTTGTAIWTGGGADNNWATAANWLGNTAPFAFDSLVFDQNVRLASNNNLAANTRFDGLTFATSAGSFTLTGNSIVLSGGITDSSLN